MRIGSAPSRVKASFTLITLSRGLGVLRQKPPCPHRVNFRLEGLDSTPVLAKMADKYFPRGRCSRRCEKPWRTSSASTPLSLILKRLNRLFLSYGDMIASHMGIGRLKYPNYNIH